MRTWLPYPSFFFALLASPCTGAIELPNLAGAIDLHCHAGPDVVPRRLDDLALAREARERGLRAIVLKNHVTMTADRARLAMREVGGIEVFGGIVLNLAVGGLNAEAVRQMVAMEGGRGRIVWLPTRDAANEAVRAGVDRPHVPVVEAGRPTPALAEIFRLIAEHDLVLATGHSSAEESIVVLRAARAAGVRRMLVTHALSPTIASTPGDLRTLADLGAFLECVWLTHAPSARPRGGVPPNFSRAPVPLADLVEVIRTVGAGHIVLASDFGQPDNPSPPEGLAIFLESLLALGVSRHEIDEMVKRNPARLLGLDEPAPATP